MSEAANADFETFKKTRSQKFRESLNHIVRRFTHRGWVETEAAVRFCKLIRSSYPIQSRSGAMPPGGYAVTFTYGVNGKTYDEIAF